MTFLNHDVAWAGLLALVCYISWWQGLIAERTRRHTLQMLVEKASTATVVWQENSWGKAAVTMWIGAGDPTGQEGSS